MSISFTTVALLLVATARAAFPDCTNGVLKNNTVFHTSASPLDRATAFSTTPVVAAPAFPVLASRHLDIASGVANTAHLNLTLGSLARHDEQGNRVLYPGDYAVVIDTPPLAVVNFTLTGEQMVLEEWPQPPAERGGSGIEGLEGYFVGGYGSG